MKYLIEVRRALRAEAKNMSALMSPADYAIVAVGLTAAMHPSLKILNVFNEESKGRVKVIIESHC